MVSVNSNALSFFDRFDKLHGIKGKILITITKSLNGERKARSNVQEKNAKKKIQHRKDFYCVFQQRIFQNKFCGGIKSVLLLLPPLFEEP